MRQMRQMRQMNMKTINNKYINACLIGDTEVIEYMIKKEDKRIKTHQLLTECLEIACRAAHKDIVDIILKYRNITICKDDALYYACMGGNIEIINMIVNVCLRIYTDEDMKKQWLYSVDGACRGGNTNIVKLCIKKIPPDLCDIDFWNNCLYSACESGNIHLVNYILDKGATNYNESLAEACDYGHLQIVKRLIKKGANRNHRYALFYACKKGNIELIKFLTKTSNVNWDHGMTGACIGGHMESVKLMIKHHITSWDFCVRGACEGGNMDIIKLVVKKGGNDWIDWNECMINACEKGHLETVKFIIQKMDDWDGVDGVVDWNYGFGGACLKGHIEIAKLLIKHGANAFDDALVRACTNRQDYQDDQDTRDIPNDNIKMIEMIKLLIEKGATCFNDALYNHVTNSYYIDIDVVKLLISKGANNFDCLEEIWLCEDLRLYQLYCKFDGIITRDDAKYLNILVNYPPYVLFMGRITKTKKCYVRKLPVELFRLLFNYL